MSAHTRSTQRASRTARHADDDRAFTLDTGDGGDDLGETFVENVTGADDAASEHRQETTAEEEGGPFVITSAEVELAEGTDASNPPDAEREALPTTSRRARP